MKGIILAAGKGSRLYPMTRPVCKPLLPVYDKPMIYYPLAVLLQAGIRDILIIIPPGEEGPFYRLLGSGGRFGVNITYEVQDVARGIADALLIGRQFIGSDDVCLVLVIMWTTRVHSAWLNLTNRAVRSQSKKSRATPSQIILCPACTSMTTT